MSLLCPSIMCKPERTTRSGWNSSRLDMNTSSAFMAPLEMSWEKMKRLAWGALNWPHSSPSRARSTQWEEKEEVFSIAAEGSHGSEQAALQSAELSGREHHHTPITPPWVTMPLWKHSPPWHSYLVGIWAGCLHIVPGDFQLPSPEPRLPPQMLSLSQTAWLLPSQAPWHPGGAWHTLIHSRAPS